MEARGGFEVFGGTLNFGNTIIAGNNSPNYPEILNFDTNITSAGNNFVGDAAGDSTNTNAAIAYQMSDIRDQNPMLGVCRTTADRLKPALC